VFVVTFQPRTDVREVLQIKKLCHCITRWENYKNTKPARQYFNCIFFGHSFNYYCKPQNASSAINYMRSGNAKNPMRASKCVNCGGAHPANFPDCPSFQQLNSWHQQQPRLPKTTTPASHFKQAYFPALKPSTSPPWRHKIWAQAASQPTTPTDPQSLSKGLETVKSISTMFDIQKQRHNLCSLVLQLQKTSDVLSKIMVVTWCWCYLFYEFSLTQNLRIVVWNANSVKSKKIGAS